MTEAEIDAAKDAREERAAILEWCAGLSRADAELFADRESAEFMHYCDVKSVLKKEKVEDRRRYLALVEAKRGAAAAKRLADDVSAAWKLRK